MEVVFFSIGPCVCLAVGLMRPGVEQFVWVRQLVAKEQRADSHSLSHTHTLRWGLGWAAREESTEKRTDRAREGEERRGRQSSLSCVLAVVLRRVFSDQPPF